MFYLRKFNTIGIFTLLLLLTGCATESKQNTLTPKQQKQIQAINTMQARWRNEDRLNYARVPGGNAAWQQLNYH